MYKQNEGTQHNQKNTSPSKGKMAEANKGRKNKEDKNNTMDNDRNKQDQSNKTH